MPRTKHTSASQLEISGKRKKSKLSSLQGSELLLTPMLTVCFPHNVRRLEWNVGFSVDGIIANTALMMAVFYLLSFFMLAKTIPYLFQCAFSSSPSKCVYWWLLSGEVIF